MTEIFIIVHGSLQMLVFELLTSVIRTAVFISGFDNKCTMHLFCDVDPKYHLHAIWQLIEDAVVATRKLSDPQVNISRNFLGSVLPTIPLVCKYKNWVVPCKPAPIDYFVAIFQVAQDRLKFCMSNLFVLKYVPVFFFKNAEKYGQNWVKFITATNLINVW